VQKLRSNIVSEKIELLNNEYGLVQIKDQGEGIPEEKLARIFEKFQRINGPSSKAQKGTGLGLAISKEIINAQGGEIWVESIAGSGSTFSFVLPLYYAQLKENDENIVLPQSNVEERVGSKKKILVVDDDANIRRFIIAALDDLSCRFFEAGDGLMAIQMGRSVNPDLVILDIQMEPLNGLDVLSVFSHDEKMSNVPILVLTVKNIDKKFMEKAIELGAKTVLQKPIDTNQLEGIVRSIIEADSPLP
jgi:CheY-like chemotaxis protein